MTCHSLYPRGQSSGHSEPMTSRACRTEMGSRLQARWQPLLLGSNPPPPPPWDILGGPAGRPECEGLSAREDSSSRLGLGSMDRQTARPWCPRAICRSRSKRAAWFAGGCRWPAARPPPARPGAGGRHRLHFKVIVIFDLWDLRGHWSSILEPLTSNLWAIFMASKHCPLIELIEICIWFVGKGYGFAAQMCSCASCCCFPPSPHPFPPPALKHAWKQGTRRDAHTHAHAHTPGNTHTYARALIQTLTIFVSGRSPRAVLISCQKLKGSSKEFRREEERCV